MLKKKYFYIFLVVLLIIIAAASGYFAIKNKKDNHIENVQGNLVISTFSRSGKGDILLYDLDTNSETSLISDSKVAVNGDISSDGHNVTYVNALNDDDPWEVYVHKIGEDIKKDKKVTDDENGKASPRIGEGSFVYYLTGDTSGRMQIGRVDTKSKSISLIDDKSSDCQADAMDIKDDKIIMSSTLSSVYQKCWEANDGEDKPITHSIYEMEKDGENLKKIIDFQAASVESISYSPDGSSAIISGHDINGNAGVGVFKISLESGEIELLFNKETFATVGQGIISDFANPSLSKMSLDQNLIYFTGVSANSEPIEIEGIQCYPAAVFSYDINSMEIKKVYEPKEPGFVFDLNIKY